MRAGAVFGTSALGRPSRAPVTRSSMMRHPAAASAPCEGGPMVSTAESGSSDAGFAATAGFFAAVFSAVLAADGTASSGRAATASKPRTMPAFLIPIVAPQRGRFSLAQRLGGAMRCAGDRFETDRMAALIAWMLVVRVGDLVKDGAKRRRLRRSSILDKIANTNRNAVQAIKA